MDDDERRSESSESSHPPPLHSPGPLAPRSPHSPSLHWDIHYFRANFNIPTQRDDVSVVVRCPCPCPHHHHCRGGKRRRWRRRVEAKQGGCCSWQAGRQARLGQGRAGQGRARNLIFFGGRWRCPGHPHWHHVRWGRRRASERTSEQAGAPVFGICCEGKGRE